MPCSTERSWWLLWVPVAMLALACDSSATTPRAGTGGTGGGGGGGGSALLDCSRIWSEDNSTYVVAYANPADFSVNSETGMRDQHTAMISLADWSARRTMYMTGGSAAHQHEIPISDALLEDLRLHKPITATTAPPAGDAAGHTHVVMFRSCGVPGN